MTDAKPVYPDYNATTPLDPEVIEAMRPYLEEHFGNPSSGHWYVGQPRKAVAEARARVAEVLPSAAEEVVFTSGGSESNNHALKGAALAARARANPAVPSRIEHPAVTEVCRWLAERGGCGGGHPSRNDSGEHHAREQSNRHGAAHRRDRARGEGEGRADEIGRGAIGR